MFVYSSSLHYVCFKLAFSDQILGHGDLKNYEIGPVTKKFIFSEAQIVFAIFINESCTRGAEIARRFCST